MISTKPRLPCRFGFPSEAIRSGGSMVRWRILFGDYSQSRHKVGLGEKIVAKSLGSFYTKSSLDHQFSCYWHQLELYITTNIYHHRSGNNLVDSSPYPRFFGWFRNTSGREDVQVFPA